MDKNTSLKFPAQNSVDVFANTEGGATIVNGGQPDYDDIATVIYRAQLRQVAQLLLSIADANDKEQQAERTR